MNSIQAFPLPDESPVEHQSANEFTVGTELSY